MCLPSDIPEAINVDVADLMIGDSLRLKDLVQVYSGVDFLDDPEIVLATVIPPTVEEVKVAAEGEEEVEEGAEPEVIAKDADAKKEEEEGEEAK
jgi:large subunit ribosomal protein L25